MKTFKSFTLTVFALFCASLLSAQTADEIIGKYIQAIGGKEKITQISSMYSEATLDVMGSQGTTKTTLLNGKGVKSETDVMGTAVTMCWTDSAGWAVNPMSGNYNAEYMPPAQYKAGKDNIFLIGPFLDYATKGFQLELAGQQTVGNVNAYKVLVTSPDSVVTEYYFDPDSSYLVQVVQKSEMMGQIMDIVSNYSNFKKTENGFVIPYTIETNYGGQFFLTANITKVEFNQPVDPAIFKKP
jgi:hypothetical protein